uniref:GNAT family N-acetyltransferase n=1 Tax=Streptomyces sp. f51 TaxID=1827742 RepID=UPI00403FCDAD
MSAHAPSSDEDPDLGFLWLDLSRPEDAVVFAAWRQEWLGLLSVSYGRLNHRDELHLARVHGEGCRLLLAVEGEGDRARLVGCSYVREDGRRSATAVDPRHRGRGLGHSLVRETVRRFPYQFSEVRPANAAQRRILEKNGFARVADPAAVRRILGPLLSGLIDPSSVRESDGSYVRSSQDAARKGRYVLYERRPASAARSPRPPPLSPCASDRTGWRRSPGRPPCRACQRPVCGPST